MARTPSARPAAVLLDLDGTLADSLPTLASITNAILDERGRVALPLSTLRGFVGDGPARLVERALDATGGASAQEASAAAADFLRRYEASSVEGTVLFAGVAEGLGALRAAGVRLAVCTNKPEAVSRLLLGGLGILDCFGAVIGGDSCARRKPFADPALEACRLLGVEPAETWFVGDNEHDVACGRAAGCASVILVRYGYSREPLDELHADVVVDSLDELPRLLA